jgi:hypothetical protein
MRINIVCSECGSDDVRRDAWAAWDVEGQCWELAAVFDQGFCEACECERSLDEVRVQTPPTPEEGVAA